MNKYFSIVAAHIAHHQTAYVRGGRVAIAIVIAGLLAGLFIYNNPKVITYQPTNACDLLTRTKAQQVLGEKVLHVGTHRPALSGDISDSKCSYTDDSLDAMKVAAVAVRSGVNDDGVAQNKAEFMTRVPTENHETVKGLGQAAYFNYTLGQLNILDGRRWIIVSYGIGDNPQGNSLEQTVELARSLLTQ